MGIIDTHAHMSVFEANIEEITNNMKNDRLISIINIGTGPEDNEIVVSDANRYKNVFASVGFHPEYANNWYDDYYYKMKELAKNQKVVAIGEFGLDYHYAGFDKERQKYLCQRMIDLAYECRLPMSLHIRDAEMDMLKILKKNKSKLVYGVIAHCFSGSTEVAKEYIKLGLNISLSGNFTYKNKNREFLKVVPVNKLLVETDSPFLTPEPKRGQKNEPAYTKYIVKKLAEELTMNENELEEILKENSFRVFSRMRLEK